MLAWARGCKAKPARPSGLTVFLARELPRSWRAGSTLRGEPKGYRGGWGSLGRRLQCELFPEKLCPKWWPVCVFLTSFPRALLRQGEGRWGGREGEKGGEGSELCQRLFDNSR